MIAAAAGGALALIAAGSGGAGAATAQIHHTAFSTVTAGLAGHIVLAGGKCLQNSGNRGTNGNPVVVATCSSNADEEWTPYSDGTIRTLGGTRVLAAQQTAINGAHPVVITNAPTGTPPENTTWFPLGNKEIVSTGQFSTAASEPGGSCPGPGDCMASLAVLTSQITGKVVVAPATGGAAQQWTVPGSHYAVSKLTNRPDSGGSGSNWALDTMSRASSITFVGRTGGLNDYLGSVVDTGSFVAFPGNATPNQGLDPGKTIGDSLTGAVSGVWGQEFTSSAPQSTVPPATVNGVAFSTGTWESLFFAPSATVTFTDAIPNSGDPDQLDWAWHYTSGKDNCGGTQTWLDANGNGGGQDATGGDITAPAPGSAC
jgi:hypothetical protein